MVELTTRLVPNLPGRNGNTEQLVDGSTIKERNRTQPVRELDDRQGIGPQIVWPFGQWLRGEGPGGGFEHPAKRRVVPDDVLEIARHRPQAPLVDEMNR